MPVLIDRVQLESALANLATNARHAMPRGGSLTIRTHNTHLDEDYAETHVELVSGNYALIEVSDTGTGMTPDVVSRIFEPFFTTKGPGQGTGLGLSMVFGFMKQSGGHVSVYSEVGEGTTFRLYLQPADNAPEPDRAEPEQLPKSRGNETILAVEDNPALRRILARQLATAGYHVLEAENARTALDRIESGEAVDLLLTDIVMPGGMNGHELAKVAVQLQPSLKTLLTSGDAETRHTPAAHPPLRNQDPSTVRMRLLDIGIRSHMLLWTLNKPGFFAADSFGIFAGGQSATQEIFKRCAHNHVPRDTCRCT
jgi:CheY-like chemotaxis protein